MHPVAVPDAKISNKVIELPRPEHLRRGLLAGNTWTVPREALVHLKTHHRRICFSKSNAILHHKAYPSSIQCVDSHVI